MAPVAKKNRRGVTRFRPLIPPVPRLRTAFRLNLSVTRACANHVSSPSPVVNISLNADKKTMLELRVKRRLRSLSLDSFGQYCDYLFGPHGEREELVHLLDVVSTNKTDFFREPEHFDFLMRKAIPELMARNESGRPLLLWSAGCSTGEEPYTLAMVLKDWEESHHTGCRQESSISAYGNN